jgi:hypothetical protein
LTCIGYGHAKVGNLGPMIPGKKNVGGLQVTMDDIFCVQVSHAIRHI